MLSLDDLNNSYYPAVKNIHLSKVLTIIRCDIDNINKLDIKYTLKFFTTMRDYKQANINSMIKYILDNEKILYTCSNKVTAISLYKDDYKKLKEVLEKIFPDIKVIVLQ